jgi:uncharacterized membrane protein YbhN (UPF0104 family)
MTININPTAPTLQNPHPLRRLLAALAALGLLGGAAWLLHHELRTITWSMVRNAIGAMPRWRIIGALLATGMSFAMLSFYDVLSAQTVAPGRVRRRLAALAGAAGTAVSNTLGFHVVTGSAVRYRMYASAGLGQMDIARIIALSGAAIGLGFASIIALALLADPVHIPHWPSERVGHALGALLLLAFAAMLQWLRQSRRIVWRSWSLPLPGAGRTFLLLLCGVAEMSGAVLCLYLLLPEGVAPSLGPFALIYVSGVLLSIMSHAPGGVGVFEATVLAGLNARDNAPVVAALLLYRVIYNLLPFFLACVAIGIFEMRRRRGSR